MVIRLSDQAKCILQEVCPALNFYSEYIPLSEAIEKLGEYEDLEMEPEEIARELS